MLRIGALTALLLTTMTACDGGGAEESEPQDDGIFGITGWATTRSLLPGGKITYYSGFDGTNAYQVPLGFVGNGDVQIAVDDAAIGNVVTTLTVDNSSNDQIPAGIVVNVALIRTLAAGSTTVTATLDGEAYTADLIVNAYTPDDVVLGDARYNSPADENLTDRVSCNSCHATLNRHATAFLADLNDDEILRTAVEGTGISVRDPATGQVTTYEPNDGNHTWGVTTEERTGIAAYLRSRSPLFQLPSL